MNVYIVSQKNELRNHLLIAELRSSGINPILTLHEDNKPSFFSNSLYLSLHGRSPTSREDSCALGHFEALLLSDRADDPITVIFEDDAKIVDFTSFNFVVKTALKMKGQFIINLYSTSMNVSIPVLGKAAIFRTFNNPNKSVAYVVSRSLRKKSLSSLSWGAPSDFPISLTRKSKIYVTKNSGVVELEAESRIGIRGARQNRKLSEPSFYSRFKVYLDNGLTLKDFLRYEGFVYIWKKLALRKSA